MSHDQEARFSKLHTECQERLGQIIAAGADPVEAIEAMLTVAIVNKLQLEGPARTAHALHYAAGGLRAHAAQEGRKKTTLH
jgi:hypothetical protein